MEFSVYRDNQTGESGLSITHGLTNQVEKMCQMSQYLMCFETRDGPDDLSGCCVAFLLFINARYFFSESFKPKVVHTYSSVGPGIDGLHFLSWTFLFF